MLCLMLAPSVGTKGCRIGVLALGDLCRGVGNLVPGVACRYDCNGRYHSGAVAELDATDR